MTTAQMESPIASLDEALRELGATPDLLTEGEKAQFDRDGFFVFESLITREEAKHLADVLDQIATHEGEKAGTDFHTEVGTTRLGNLMNKSDAFDICFSHPKVLAAIAYATRGNFGVSSLTGRAALPGEGAQGLHVDFSRQLEPGKWKGCAGIAANALFVLDDFTADNGPTRIVPGSHKIDAIPSDRMNPDDSHPDEIALIAPAGTVAVIDSATWHGGTRNNTDTARHLLSVMCQPRDEYQGFAYRKITPETAARLSPAQLFILDHEIG